jgi:dihydrofolate reductase
MIWAQGLNKTGDALGIGFNGDLPWNLPEDLKHFRDTTMGKSVIMGRNTFMSLPGPARPLKGRTNIVITRDKSFTYEFDKPDTELIIVNSIEECNEYASNLNEEIYVIGGASIYNDFINYADKLVVTNVEGTFDIDTYAPNIDPDIFKIESDSGKLISETGIEYSILTYIRRTV